MTFPRFLAAGLLISLAFHGAGSAYFAADPNDVQIGASQGGGVSVIGSLEDLVAGSKVEVVSPVETVEEIEPETELVEMVQAEPVEVAKIETPVAVQEVLIETPPTPVLQEITPVVAGVTTAETVTAETAAPQVPKPESAQPVETAKLAEAKSVETVEDVKPVEDTALDPLVKTPEVKPEPPVRDVKRVEIAEPLKDVTPVTETKPVEKKKKKTKSAQKRGADRNSQKGGAQITSQTAKSNANGRADAKTNDGGTAAASNYKGKVFAKVRRAQRYPRQAERKRIEGTVHVSFDVASSGAVSGIRVVRSSGHAILDEAAVDQVRRAAPMPNFPKDVSQNRITFKARIAFKSRR